ncbi:ATP-binding protein [Nubsella zeaxanthinifaciens]|uniref:sensor histidine kinase n=1 Tax=Nubsella zeaxanthinifaciens TaxID=392412 RepID=UPI003CFF5DEF
MPSKSQEINDLKGLNEELENYFNNTIIPQLFVDADLVLKKFTPPAMNQFDLQPDDIGKPIEEIKDNFRFPTIVKNIKEVISTGQILEKEIQTLDRCWYQMNILPYIVRKENRTNGVIITFVDITPRIRALRELEKVVAENELLIDTLAHDIKTPITAMGLTIQMLKKIATDRIDSYHELLGYLENSHRRLTAMVSELVQSRWSENPYSPVGESVRLQDILEDVKLSLARQISDIGASIECRIEVKNVFLPRRHLRSILYNLVNNAIKYRFPDRRLVIKISASDEDNFTVVEVSDNGIGIANENLATIFNKFQRVKSTIEGNGVGLYLVREMLKASGSRITVSSVEGEGTSFKIYLRHHNAHDGQDCRLD